MSFNYKSQTITLENYRKVFKACSPDIQDEIRSAVMDGTPIASYINECGVDSYKLGQIRIGLREYLPIEYLNTLLTGRTIYYIRQMVREGIDAEPLFKYVEKEKLLLPKATIEKIAEFMYLGTNIEMVDFREVKEEKLDLVLDGLRRNFPMWLILDYDVDYMRSLMRGMQLEIDITPFLNGKWSEKQLYLLYSYRKQIDLFEFLEYVNENFDVDRLKVLLKAFKKGIPITSICVQESDGYPIYNAYQMEELSKAIEDKTITHQMYNPQLSDESMRVLHEKELEKRKPKPKKLKLSGLTDITEL